MFKNEKNSEDKELYEFLQSNSKSHYLQTPEWAQVKLNWKHEMIVIRNDKKIVGTMSILLKKIPILKSYMMYAPRGFVCDPDDKETLKKMTEAAKQIAKKYNAFIFRMDPDISDCNNCFKEIMKSLGYKVNTKSKTIQPQYVYRLDIKNKTPEELLKSLKSKTRYNIRLAIRKNVKIREGTKNDIKIFYEILKCTAKRDHFYLRDISIMKEYLTVWELKIQNCFLQNVKMNLLLQQCRFFMEIRCGIYMAVVQTNTEIIYQHIYCNGK